MFKIMVSLIVQVMGCVYEMSVRQFGILEKTKCICISLDLHYCVAGYSFPECFLNETVRAGYTALARFFRIICRIFGRQQPISFQSLKKVIHFYWETSQKYIFHLKFIFKIRYDAGYMAKFQIWPNNQSRSKA